MTKFVFARPHVPVPFLPLLRLLAAVIALAPACWAAAAPSATRPNIIFILVDDLGYGDLGVFFQSQRRASGNRAAALTPNLDTFAAGGARLTDHYSAAPVCAPSRASLLGGVHQGHATVRDNQFDKALAENHTLGTVLQRAGYATAVVGKWGLQGRVENRSPNWPAHPQNRGFDFFFGYIRHVDGHEHYPKEAPYWNRLTTPSKKGSGGDEDDDANPDLFGKEVWENRREISTTLDKCYTTDLFTARAKRWISDQHAATPRQPFLLYLAFDTPHATLELPPCAYPSGGGLSGGVQWLGTPGKAINTATGKVDSWVHPDYAEATYRDPAANPSAAPKPWPDVYRRYATSVRRIDDAIGDLAQLLRDLGIEENTLVVFTSDNGPSIESYLPEAFSPEFFASFGPFDGIKRDLWEGGTRVPTLARWPAKIPAGLVVTAPSANWDWLPTFADAAGLPPPALADGVSLLPALAGKPAPTDATRRMLYFEYSNNERTPDFPGFEPARRNRLRNQMQSLRLGDFSGVRYDVKSADDDFEIYDVRADPKQSRNLADESRYAELQTRMKQTVLQVRRPNASAPRPYDAAPVPPASVDASAPGVAWTRYDEDFPWVPATESLRAASRGMAEGPDVRALAPAVGAFAATFEGCIAVPTEGDYTFTLAADTGALLRLHEATLIDCDYGYAAGSERTATVKLAAGLHPFRLTYRHAGSAAPALTLEWSGPGIARQPLGKSALRH